MRAHLLIQFQTVVDVASSRFAFRCVRLDAQPSWCDYLGEHFSAKSPQQSLYRGFFYVWADKVGTMRMPDELTCVDGDYAPCMDSVQEEVQGDA